MKFIKALAFLIFAACAGSGASHAQVTDVSPENAAVNAAIEKARQTLPAFFARLKNPQPGDNRFQVKIRFPKPQGGGEHIWAGDIVRNGDNISATIDNDPVHVDLKRGQRVNVPVADITDWLYWRNGKMHGAVTVRALLPFMQPDQAARLRDLLAPE